MNEKTNVINETEDEVEVIDAAKIENKITDNKPKKKKGKIVAIVIVCVLLVACIVGGIIFFVDINNTYNWAVSNKKNSPIDAYHAFGSVSWYKDAKEQQTKQKAVILEIAISEIDSGNLEKASQLLDFLGNYPGVDEARAQLDEANKEVLYSNAVKQFEAGLYGSAKSKFEKLKGYKDVDEYLDNFAYKLGSYYPSLSYNDSYYHDFVQMYFEGDTLLMGSGSYPTFYLYIIVESDEDYQCTHGDYEVWIMGEMYNGKKIYYDNYSLTKIIGIDNPKFDEDGMVSEFYVDGIKYLATGF